MPRPRLREEAPEVLPRRLHEAPEIAPPTISTRYGRRDYVLRRGLAVADLAAVATALAIALAISPVRQNLDGLPGPSGPAPDLDPPLPRLRPL